MITEIEHDNLVDVVSEHYKQATDFLLYVEALRGRSDSAIEAKNEEEVTGLINEISKALLDNDM